MEQNSYAYHTEEVKRVKAEKLKMEKIHGKKKLSFFDRFNKKKEVIEVHNPYEEQEDSFVDKIYIDLNLTESINPNALLDSQFDNDINQIAVQKCTLLLGLNSGFVLIYEIEDFLKNLKFLEHSNKRPNYNPYRLAHEDYIQQIDTNNLKRLNLTEDSSFKSDEILNFDKFKINHIYAHKNALTSLKLIKIPQRVILTT